MVVCDGFNVPPPGVEIASTNDDSMNKQPNSLPFPRVPPPQPPARQSIPNLNGHNGNFSNGNHKSNGLHDDLDSSIQAQSKLQITSSSNCNYDNLRSIDSDDSRLTSPEPSQCYSFNATPNNFKINQTPTNKPAAVNAVQQQITSSLPLTDKNIMSNIMNKSNNIDIKSQSMMANPNTTPVTVVNY